MTRQGLLTACGLFLLLSLQRAAYAQDKPWLFSTPDENAQRAPKEGGRGVLFVETIISEKGNDQFCSKMELFMARVSDGMNARFPTRLAPVIPGFGKTLGGASGLLAGDYVVTGINCMPISQSTLYNGPHARLRIREGEVINAGAIRLDIRGREGFSPQITFVHRSIEALTPDVIAYFKETYPKTFSRVTNRPMSLVGSPDVQYKGKF
jgi:hypothetical protein